MKDVVLRARGLYTSPNVFDLPPGALTYAMDVIIRRSGVLEQMRKYEAFSTLAGAQRARALHEAGGALYASTYDGAAWAALSIDGTGVATNLGALAAPPDSGFRHRGAAARGRLMLVGSDGVKVVDPANGVVRQAGVPAGIVSSEDSGDNYGYTMADYSTADGFLAKNYSADYVMVIGRNAPDGTPMLGAPSSVLTVYHNGLVTASPTSVRLTLWLPAQGVRAGDFVQIYRTRTYPTSGSAPSEFFLTSEKVLAAAPGLHDGSPGGNFSVVDTTPDNALTLPLYTNASQEGADSAREQPPIARDIVEFSGSTFFLNTTGRQRILLRILTGMRVGDWIKIGAETFTARKVVSTPPFVEHDSGFVFSVYGSTPSESIEATTRGLAAAINRASSTIRAQVLSAGGGVGVIAIERYELGQPELALTADVKQHAVAAGGLVRSASVVTATIAGDVRTALGVGDKIAISGADATFATTGTVKTISYDSGLDKTTLTYDDNSGPDATSTLAATVKRTSSLPSEYFAPSVPTTVGGLYTSAEVHPNRAHFSPTDEPETSPLTWYMDIGGDGAILRGVRLGRSLLVFKEDGLFRIGGSTPDDFFWEEVDPTVHLLGPDALAVLKNTVFAVTTKGILPISEGGVGAAISEPIDDDLRDYLRIGMQDRAYAVADESEGTVEIALSTTGGNPDVCWVFNANTGTWVQSSTVGLFALTTRSDNRKYLARASVGAVDRQKLGYVAASFHDNRDATTPKATFAPFTAGDPGSLKQFTDAVLITQDTLASGHSFGFQTELAAADSVTFDPPDDAGPFPTWVPPDLQVGAALTVSVNFPPGASEKRLCVSGVKVVYEPASGSPRR